MTNSGRGGGGYLGGDGLEGGKNYHSVLRVPSGTACKILRVG